MALDVVEKIKEAEEKAEEIINTSKEESKKILANVGQKAAARKKEFERKLKEEGSEMMKNAEQKAQNLTESAKANAAVQCDKLKVELETKKNQAIELVINEILK